MDRSDERLEDARAVEADTPGVSAREGDDQILMEETSDTEQQPLGAKASEPSDEPDYKDLFLRERAESENFRKRMIKKQTEIAEHAGEDLAKRLLPVLDHFQLAIDHGEAGPGVQMAFKEMTEALAAEGLLEIEVKEGDAFDPAIHHALTSVPDPDVSEEVVKQVQRKGWRFRKHTLRAPEVVVAQPVTTEQDQGEG